MFMQDQRHKLAQFIRDRTRVPYFMGYLLGFIRPILDLQARSETANEVKSQSCVQLTILGRRKPFLICHSKLFALELYGLSLLSF